MAGPPARHPQTCRIAPGPVPYSRRIPGVVVARQEFPRIDRAGQAAASASPARVTRHGRPGRQVCGAERPDAPVTAPYAHIACCVDDTPASQVALAEARRLRALGPGRLTLVHAAPMPLMMKRENDDWVPDPRDISVVERAWFDDLVQRIPEAEGVFLEGYPPAAVC